VNEDITEYEFLPPEYVLIKRKHKDDTKLGGSLVPCKIIGFEAEGTILTIDVDLTRVLQMGGSHSSTP